ncbi:MAG: nucleotide exchange factor GrpE [Pirellulaceae bacterium]|nr:nucleotide exchange factor GrpE [Pirellulaceae bacterium]
MTDETNQTENESEKNQRVEQPQTAEEKIIALEAQLDESRNDALRHQAELENFRKRVYRDQEQERKYSTLPLLSDLLPAIDNLQRATESAKESENAASLVEGVDMVIDQLLTVLERQHCKKIEALGLPFDPNFHEAIGQAPSPAGYEPGTVTMVTREGYQLHDRVVRPAQVFVAASASS